MHDFNYVAAKEVDEVIHLLSKTGNDARILCGGTDLLVQMRERRRKAGLLIDIKRIPQVLVLSCNLQEGLLIGAAVPCQQICRDETVGALYPGLVDAISLIGGTQIQGRASLGGNLCNASPAADSIPALIVHHAVCRIVGPEGQREVPVEDFCLAPGRTALGHGEFLVAVYVPPPAPRFGAYYLRFTPRNEMDIAVVGAGASVILDTSGESIQSARLALAAVAPVPLFLPEVGEWISGKPASEVVISEAAQMAKELARPINDLRGTIPQRKHLSEVLSKRALQQALIRAREVL